ncbi:MAG TPA: branched-chain amino acid ABC transporter permease [Methylomirabilota bacterium]|nr:branched-chain amino acid ABC transporter permease [Methylomirabilota bacterium]
MTWIPFLVDGLLLGSTIALGAVGLTLTYSILGFANFTHGDLITWGAYFVLSLLLASTAATGSGLGQLGALSFGWPFLAALVVAMLLTGALGLLLDRVLFRPLRQHGTQIVLVIASFGASLALRYGLAFLYGPEPAYYTRDIQLAGPIVPGLPAVRATPNQLFVLGLTAVLVVGLHLLLTRTTLGRAMRAVSENPTLARVVGVDPQAVVRWTWLLGGALAAVGGAFVGLTVQVRPWLGFDLLLPLFAAAILGGVGSVYGAVLGGLLLGLAEALAVPLVGAEYRAAVAFAVLLAVLVVRPRGLLGVRE